jgi:hypothetical protein
MGCAIGVLRKLGVVARFVLFHLIDSLLGHRLAARATKYETLENATDQQALIHGKHVCLNNISILVLRQQSTHNINRCSYKLKLQLPDNTMKFTLVFLLVSGCLQEWYP